MPSASPMAKPTIVPTQRLVNSLEFTCAMIFAGGYLPVRRYKGCKSTPIQTLTRQPHGRDNLRPEAPAKAETTKTFEKRPLPWESSLQAV